MVCIPYDIYFDEGVELGKLFNMLNDDNIKKIKEFLSKYINSSNYLEMISDVDIQNNQDIIYIMKYLGIITEISGKYYVIIPVAKTLINICQ
ncbi:MAG: hypothetical protein ACP5GJ_02520 [Nanopusillaceae archaeon]